MNTQLNAMKKALEALESGDGWRQSEAITALRTAIEQAEKQEPVATKLETQQFNCFHVSAEDFQKLKDLPVGTKLYTSPQPAQQEPVAWRVRFHYGTDGMQKRIGDWKLYSYSPTPEKDKEVEPLYTSPPAQRKPLTYDKTELNCFAQDLYDQKMREGKHGHYESMFHVIHQCVKKVASPLAQRKPLTDEQIVKCWGQVSGTRYGYVAFARAIEAKLKEKNSD